MVNTTRISAKNNGKRHCKKCSEELVKNGKHPNGKQRWLCKVCNTSRVYKREDKQRKRQLDLFIDWLLSKKTVNETYNKSRRSFERNMNWCWNINPKIDTPEKIDIIIVDGTYIGREACLIVARDIKHVVGYVWCKRENKNAYMELFRTLPKSKVIVTDGSNVCISAAREVYGEDTAIQRCMFHVKSFVRREAIKHKKTKVGHELLQMNKELSNVKEGVNMIKWILEFTAWCEHYESANDEQEIETYKELHFAIKHLKNALNNFNLFSYVADKKIPNTTNHVEGWNKC
jgi:hypothetical protein